MQRGKHPLPDGNETLFLSAVEHYDAATHIVRGTQFYEVYGADGVMRAKSFVDIRFCLHEKHPFQELVRTEGLAARNLYGDYSRAAFEENRSPFMIWVLRDEGAPNNCGERTR